MTQLLRICSRSGVLPQLSHPVRTICDDGQNGFIDACCIAISYAVPDLPIACVSRRAKRPCGLYDLVGDLSRDFENDMKEEKGDVSVETFFRTLS